MRSYDQYCGLALALDHVGERWTLLLVRELLTGPKRYTDLREGLPGVPTNLLAARLKRLEADGIVERRVLPPPAASVVYELTPLGRGLEEAIHALVRWGGSFMRQRSRDQSFRPDWLAIALSALVEPRPDEALHVHFASREGDATLRFDGQGVSLVAPDTDAEVRVRGQPELLLGLAAGSLDWSAALAAGLEVEGSRSAKAGLRARLRGRSR